MSKSDSLKNGMRSGLDGLLSSTGKSTQKKEPAPVKAEKEPAVHCNFVIDKSIHTRMKYLAIEKNMSLRNIVNEAMKEYLEEDLGDAIDMIIDGGQVGIGLESTIVDFTEEVPVVLRPGYISLEMLQETLGDVRMDKGLLITDSSVHPKAPGMKYRHYAPKADLSIIEGNEEDVVACINHLTDEAVAKGLKVGVIATDETKARYAHADVLSIGSREEEETIAHHLYEVLRDFDDDRVDVIYSEAFYTPKMGQAIMNRLLKAAGHKIINAQEENK